MTSAIVQPAAAEPAIIDPSIEIDELRQQIDGLDESIARLIHDRAELSVRIQAARVNAGGTRVELGRERVILAHYRAALGADGPSLAEAILRVCKRQSLH